MGEINIIGFVDKYEKFYYRDKASVEKTTDEVKIYKPVEREVEAKIENLLSKGKYNLDAIKWKMGGVEDVNKNIIKTQYYTYRKDVLQNLADNISKVVKNNNLNSKDLNGYYEELLKCSQGVVGFGTVQLINAMYFLSKGEIPIYDYYAHLAVKALLYNHNPQDMYVGEAPAKAAMAKNDKSKYQAVNLLREYMYLLNQLKNESVDNDFFGKKNMFITRRLDRALWVYGHARVKWNS